MDGMNVTVYANRRGPSWPDIDEAVRDANGLQTCFKFTLQDMKRPLSGAAGRMRIPTVERVFARRAAPVTGLVFCEERLIGGTGPLVHEALPNRIYVSAQVSKQKNAPPFRLYLLYQLAAAALTLPGRLRPEVNSSMIHTPPIGCLWDWWEKDDERSTAMLIARICAPCQDALRRHCRLPPEAIAAGRQILDYVRRGMMGESPSIARRVFIAYGHTEDWKELKKMLRRWSLDAVHFESEEVTGETIPDRWKSMIDQSRFAFAVMTPDDKLANGKWRARQDVIHEIGLCHARLGLQNTAILLAHGTEPFSNMDGVNYIPFERGNIRKTGRKIKRLLEERGIL